MIRSQFGGGDVTMWVCLQAAIRKELNEFKSSEMEVHEDSRIYTRSEPTENSATFAPSALLPVGIKTFAFWNSAPSSRFHRP